MWYNLQWYFRVIYNLVRLPLVFLINRGRVRFAIVQKLSPGASIIVGKRGKIELRPRVIAERGSLIQCMGGKLTLGYKTYVNRNSLIVCHTGISVVLHQFENEVIQSKLFLLFFSIYCLISLKL